MTIDMIPALFADIISTILKNLLLYSPAILTAFLLFQKYKD